jgi:homogentisate 1,2-dioxygenase
VIDDLKYQSGFGNEFATEAEPGALPQGCNNPQKVPFGLFAEQLSGSAFTAPGAENQRSWLYKIQPSVAQAKYKKIDNGSIVGRNWSAKPTPPDQLRWDPIPDPTSPTDFVQGISTFCGNGSPQSRNGSAIHLYSFNAPMTNKAFVNADGDLLIVPQQGSLRLDTEMGQINLEPGEIAVVQRGIKFNVNALDQSGAVARGYICENFGEHFRLPGRGPIGANGLANSRDFLTPMAAYSKDDQPCDLVTKFCGELWQTTTERSPFDVVAWHGNYAPYKYDLRLFNTINTVSYDHPDPSIFTVLTSPSAIPGTANIDFVIFPDRWMVAEDTFRPPYYHRNVMSEYMGLIYGVYDAKPDGGGFVPGGGSLHNLMTPHGPETKAYEAGIVEKLEPKCQKDTMAFMFETGMVYEPTDFALETKSLQNDYLSCWSGLNARFELS